MARKIRKDDIVIGISGHLAGYMYRVNGITNKNVVAQARVVRLDPTTMTAVTQYAATYDANRFRLIADCTADEVRDYKELGERAREEDERQYKEDAERRRKELIKEYVAERRARQADPFFTTSEKRTTSEEEKDGDFYIEFAPLSDKATQWPRRLITLSSRKETYRGTPEVTVNWSAIGSVTPEEAKAFAECLLEVAIMADEERFDRERDAGIVIEEEVQ
jgi:hypothetical protein